MRPRSANYFMAPFLRRPAWERPSDFDVRSGVPAELSGYMPGTPAPPSEAGQTQPTDVYGVADAPKYIGVKTTLENIATLYGAPEGVFAMINQIDWNSDEAPALAALGLHQLLEGCGVDWEAERRAERASSVTSLLEASAGWGPRLIENVQTLTSRYCPNYRIGPEVTEPPPTRVYQQVVEAPPTDMRMVPTTAVGVPAEAAPEEKAPWGWILAGAGILTAIGVAVYMTGRRAKRGGRRKRKRNQSETVAAFAAQEIDAPVLLAENPCNCPNPAAATELEDAYTAGYKEAAAEWAAEEAFEMRDAVDRLERGPPRRNAPRKKKNRKRKNARPKKTKNQRTVVCGSVGKLTTRKRDALPGRMFGLPRTRQYPMPDSRHAAVAKGRAKQQLNRGNLSRADYNKIVRKADRILKSCNGVRGKRNPYAGKAGLSSVDPGVYKRQRTPTLRRRSGSRP